MTDLDPETKARIEAEERYRAKVRADALPIGAWVGAISGLVLAVAPFLPAFGIQPFGTVNFLIGNNAGGKEMIGVGVIVFLLALFPATRVGNIFTGFLSFVFTLYLIFGTGWSSFLQTNPQYGWVALLVGGIGAMTAGVLSAKSE